MVATHDAPQETPAAQTLIGPFQCLVSHIDLEHVAVLVRGELDLATAPAVPQRAIALLSPTISRLTVDLEELTFVDSSGLAALLTLRDLAETRGISWSLVSVPRQARLVIELTGLAARLGLEPAP